MKALLRFVVLLLFSATLLDAQTWTVRPEWVRAHEEFLASDVMAGRGSATRDEQIAATYVASEFMAYGLKTAPGMSGYLQAAGIRGTDLDGKAQLTAGAVTLREGSDFTLLISSAQPVSGPLVEVTADELSRMLEQAQAHKRVEFSAPAGAVLVTSGLTGKLTGMQVYQLLRNFSDGALVVIEDHSTADFSVARSRKTRTPMLLTEQTARRSLSLVSVSPKTLDRLRASKDQAALAVHVVPAAGARITYNAIGYLAGTDAAAGTILLTAHLDHLGIGKPVDGDAIYNGANDDAAGTTAVMELAHALASGPPLRRSVLFACYGSEEAGELGSTYFGEHPPVPLAGLVANLEFEMIGTQDPKMPAGVLLLTGWERSNLGPALKAHGALLGPDPYPEQHFFERSDNYALALKGVVAHTAAGWGTPPTYHQPKDDLAHLDLAFMTRAIQSLIEPVRWLASSDFKPAWNAGGQPVGR